MVHRSLVLLLACMAFEFGQAQSQPQPTSTLAEGLPRAASVPISIPAIPDQGGQPVRLSGLLYRPKGAGPFPLVIINHGSPRDYASLPTIRSVFLTPSSWFVAHGYAVVVPLRRGYGTSQGTFAESDGRCNNRDYQHSTEEAARDILAVFAYMRRQSFIDPSHTIIVGHSAGGWASLAAIANNPPGVVGAINFAGGRGSDAPGHVCQPERLLASAREFGRRTRVPTLWLYAENDKFFGPMLAREMFAAFTASHSAEATFVSLPAFGDDGHALVLNGTSLSIWEPAAKAFLAKLGRP